MATWLGIDIGSASVKVAVMRSAYRKLAIARVAAVDVAAAAPAPPTRADVVAAVRLAVAAALEGEPPGVDAVAVALEGSRAAIHRLSLPATAQKQLADVLAYELEAQVPFDLESAVFDWRLLERPAGDPAGELSVVAAVARIDDVRARIDLVKEAIAQEPERVGVGALVLGALVPHVGALTEADAVAIVDIGARSSEVLILEHGEPVFARTLSTGTEGLPATASRLGRDLRVSIAAHRAQGGAAPAVVYLCGGGAFVSTAEGFLAGELETAVGLLPEPALDATALGPDAVKVLPRYAKAVALALTLAGRGSGMNLRRGPLVYERGFSWVREKIPLLAGLAAVILVSFVFSAWAQLYAVHRERAVLADALGLVTKEVLGTEATTAQDAQDLLAKEIALTDDDPMPHADAFDVMVHLSEAIPESMKHDIEELDMQKGHVVVRGIVGSIPDAQSIASALGDLACLSDVKIKNTTQAVGSDRQKYALEFDVKCPEDVKSAPAKKKADTASSAAGAAGGK
jgi:general secretion pathway protein L